MKIVAVPLHIHDIDTLEIFLQRYLSIGKELGSEYIWYIDANGCSHEINKRLKHFFSAGTQENRLYVTEDGGRYKALNRALHFTRENNGKVCVFLNEDVVPNEGTIQALADSILQGELVSGSVSQPKRTTGDSPREQRNSVSLLGEYAFYDKSEQTRKSHFRGDCFAINPDFINSFPNIHSDDTYLRLKYVHKTGNEIPISPYATVTREHEWEAKKSIRRIVRYLEGRTQIQNYCLSEEPELHELSLTLCSIPQFDDIHTRFTIMREATREVLVPALRGNSNKIDENMELRLMLGEYADVYMLYSALKRYTEGYFELEGKNGAWKR